MIARRLIPTIAAACGLLLCTAAGSGASSSPRYIKAVSPRHGTPTTTFVVTFAKPLRAVKKKRIEYRITLEGPEGTSCATGDYLVVWKQSDHARSGASRTATVTARAARFKGGRFCPGRYVGTLAKLHPDHDCQTDTDTGTSHSDCSDDPDEDISDELADFRFTVSGG